MRRDHRRCRQPFDDFRRSDRQCQSLSICCRGYFARDSTDLLRGSEIGREPVFRFYRTPLRMHCRFHRATIHRQTDDQDQSFRLRQKRDCTMRRDRFASNSHIADVQGFSAKFSTICSIGLLPKCRHSGRIRLLHRSDAART